VLVVLVAAILLWRRRRSEPEPEPSLPADPLPPTLNPPPVQARSAFDEQVDSTIVVGRSFPALPKISSTSPGQPVLVARDPGSSTAPDPRPAETTVQKYCTGCGMRLGPAHSFCGYCGQPAKT
jgi:hypothetical protein